MPRLLLHTRNGDNLVWDEEGSQYASLEEARDEAVIAAREVLAERMRLGKPMGDGRFEITDETGALVLMLPFRAALVN